MLFLNQKIVFIIFEGSHLMEMSKHNNFLYKIQFQKEKTNLADERTPIIATQ